MSATFTITGGPDGEVVIDVPGGPADADLTLTAPQALARAIAAGEVDPNTAFMQGKLKVTGPTGPLLALLAHLRTDGAADLRAALQVA